ncbi:MAG: TetR/AcrR family transcriptional regulator C-terminal domain-containing protein [Acidimicrobiales bacterium]
MTATVRTALSRDVIARTALALTDEQGLAGLSMRKLGGLLGVEAMSLYHYVINKDDLLDAILDCLFAEIALPRDVPDDDWELATREGLRGFRSVLIKHSAALELFASRPAKSATAFEVLAWSHSRFHLVGLDVAESCRAFHFAVSFVMGHVATEMGTMALLRDGKGIDLQLVDDPVVRSLMVEHRTITSDDMFERGLDAVVAGLRALYRLP